MRTRLTFLLTGLLVLGMAIPAIAITNGAPDDDDGATYDAVGNLLFYVPSYDLDPRFSSPGGWFTCTGTLIADDVVVTAGHCTYDIGVDGVDPDEAPREPADAPVPNSHEGGTDVWITFEADATAAYEDVLVTTSAYYAQREAELNGDDDPDNDIDGNAERYADWSSALDANADGSDGLPQYWHKATAHSHPDYIDAAFFLYDLGILELDEGVHGVDNYGQLPDEGALDVLQNKRRNDQLFTAVGYGIQEIVPFFQSDDVRYEATVRLLTTKGTHGIDGIKPGTSVVFSNNNGKAARGGTCFGDSGGPIFFGTDTPRHVHEDGDLVLAGVTSYGVSPNCTGTGGVYRIDNETDLAFIRSFLPDA